MLHGLQTVRRDRSTVPEPSHAKVKEMVWNPSNVSEDTIQSLRAASLGLLHSGPLEAAQIAGRLALQVDFRPPPRSAVVAAAAASSDAQPPGPLVDEIKGDADRRAVFTAAKTAVSAAVAAADPSTLPKSKKKLKRFEVYVRRQIFRPERKAHIKAIRQERKAEKKAARLAAAAAGTIPIAAAGNLDSVNVSPASVTAATPAVTVSGVGSPNESTHTPSASSAAAVIAMDTTQS